MIRRVQAARLATEMLEVSLRGSTTWTVTFQLSESLRVEELKIALENMTEQVCLSQKLF